MIVRLVLRLGGPTTDGPRIEYRSCPDATPEGEARVLAGIYTFLIEQAERKKDARTECDMEGAERGD